jgi:uncharacterized protein (TIGR02646 family)
MKYVRKGRAPHDFRQWCTSMRGTPNEDYRCLMNPEKTNLQHALLSEQGWLCAYTMRQVDESISHIEHIKPETLCRAERVGADLDYRNLVACFPRDGMNNSYRYGAQQKGEWWDGDGSSFVSPLHPNCERCFSFDIDGNIKAVGNRISARTTISVLSLDHPSLTEDRKRAIHEFIYGQDGSEPLSRSKALQAIRIICNRSRIGRFVEFCIAIRYALYEHVKQLQKLAARRRYYSRRQ